MLQSEMLTSACTEESSATDQFGDDDIFPAEPVVDDEPWFSDDGPEFISHHELINILGKSCHV